MPEVRRGLTANVAKGEFEIYPRTARASCRLSRPRACKSTNHTVHLAPFQVLRKLLEAAARHFGQQIVTARIVLVWRLMRHTQSARHVAQAQTVDARQGNALTRCGNASRSCVVGAASHSLGIRLAADTGASASAGPRGLDRAIRLSARLRRKEIGTASPESRLA
jgi:hypothetical protein